LAFLRLAVSSRGETPLLKIHLSNGKTLSFNLCEQANAKELMELFKAKDFQESIRGMTVLHKGVSYSLVRPTGFSDVFFLAEDVAADPESKIKGGERITCFVDNLRLGLMVHQAQRSVRVSVAKVGRQRYNPYLR